MKKILFFLFILFIFCYVNATNLSTIDKFFIQSSNVIIQEYNNEPFVITDDWLDESGNVSILLDYDVKYVKTITYYSITGIPSLYSEELVTKEEFDKIGEINTRGSCVGSNSANDCWETNGKKLSIYLYINGSLPNVKVLVLNQWKIIPVVKSYDVIGLYYNLFTESNSVGYQFYNIQSNTIQQQISYSNGGTNMKKSSHGVSISQNIVDNTYSLLENQLWVYGTLGSNFYGQFTASYQHSINNISLATSKDFNFSVSGMGRVFLWNSGSNNWDNMTGVCINYSEYLWYC